MAILWLVPPCIVCSAVKIVLTKALAAYCVSLHVIIILQAPNALCALQILKLPTKIVLICWSFYLLLPVFVAFSRHLLVITVSYDQLSLFSNLKLILKSYLKAFH